MEKEYYVHESSFVDEDVSIGAGTRIWHFSHIMPGARIGNKCNIGQNVYIGPKVKIGNNVKIQNNVSIYEGVELQDHVFCGPSSVFTNVMNPRSEYPRDRDKEFLSTPVGQGATIGANVTVVCGNKLGHHCFIGAGSVVTKDVSPYALVYGNPAVQKGWMCECGVKIEFSGSKAACPTCGKKYALQDNSVEKTG